MRKLSEYPLEYITALREACALWRYALYSSLVKISLRNAGSTLGFLWEPLSTLLVSIALTLVWSRVLQIESDTRYYFVYVYVGMVIWGWMASSVSNLCATLVKNSNGLTTLGIPKITYVFEDIFLSFVPFLLSIPSLAIVLIIYGSEVGLYHLALFFLGVLLVLVTSLGFALSIGLLAFFIGDIRQLITAVMRLSFLVTPVIWNVERLGDAKNLILFNPFYGYLHILRNSLMGQEVQVQYIVQAVVLTASVLVISVIIFGLLKRQIQQRALSL